MSKLFNNIFGNKATTTATSNSASSKMDNITMNGKLETDALPIDDEDTANANLSISSTATPTVSAEMTADAVLELSDPNYNSAAAMMELSTNRAGDADHNAMAVGESNSTMNTMNVNNAQQQLVMQFNNANNVHFGSVYNFNGNTNTSAGSLKSSCSTEEAGVGVEAKRSTTTTPQKTVSIVAMMQSFEEPNHRMLATIAAHLGEGWKLVMRELGNSEGQIEQAVIDHQMHGGIKEVIYQLLLQWIRNAEDGEATLGRITTLLWEMNHRECVRRMKLVWKSNSLRKSSTR